MSTMSGVPSAKGTGRKRLFFRCGIAVLWAALGVLVFVFFRGHSLLVDNRDLAEGPAGSVFRAPGMISVSVDGGKTVSLVRGGRGLFTVKGAPHRIRVEFPDGGPPVEAAFRLGMKDDAWILSVPALLAGREPFLEVFSGSPGPAPEEESPAAEE